MVKKKSITLKCPKCGETTPVLFHRSTRKFVLYTCPKCDSNVVYYNNHVDVISDALVQKLMKKGKLRFCGNLDLKSRPKESRPVRDRVISKDDILDLRILLAKEEDVEKIVSKL